MLYTVINDQFIPAHEAQLHVSDLAVNRGYAIFDFFKTQNGKPVFIEDHLDRFYQSARFMHLDINHTRDELKALLRELMDKNNLPYSGIRITLTGGYADDGYTLAKSNMIITQQAIKVKPLNIEGIKLATYSHQRQFAQAKTIDYQMAIWLQPYMREQGADDLLYHHNNIVRECPRANFFIVTQNNEILTTATDVLKGIIRKQVLSLANTGFTIKEQDISLDDVLNCKEAFITSTTKNILSVTQINGRLIGNGNAGKITTALSKQLAVVIAHNTGW
ncbi:aminotransferase class IV [Mucilaginibacter aquatilis]|uniref:branched-chain-amino-acid transaminase n=1 Tax=Mucilaginibacter aquatilis TaxID=1517760 RepID=A0A6I4I7W6_9SPHI|nr:aminotransferase class IV [Mucilaginibacter aquatilis]MVN89559.1 amino acid aminotransferase [Mucilaginibacter aquatilis]